MMQWILTSVRSLSHVFWNKWIAFSSWSIEWCIVSRQRRVFFYDGIITSHFHPWLNGNLQRLQGMNGHKRISPSSFQFHQAAFYKYLFLTLCLCDPIHFCTGTLLLCAGHRLQKQIDKLLKLVESSLNVLDGDSLRSIVVSLGSCPAARNMTCLILFTCVCTSLAVFSFNVFLYEPASLICVVSRIDCDTWFSQWLAQLCRRHIWFLRKTS